MGPGLDSLDARVDALAVLDNKLYAAGYFDQVCIACWDPVTSTWSTLGSGTDGQVYALTVLENKLYVGGKFRHAGGVAGPRIACWDPATSAWSSLGTGVGDYDQNTAVHALTTLDGKVYAGGREFYTAGGVSVSNIACWDPATSTWSDVGSGVDYDVRALGVFNGRLYVGGDFYLAGAGEANVAVNRIACWDPGASTWSALSTGMGAEGYYQYPLYVPKIAALAGLDGKLYAGGTFTTAGGVLANRIASWELTTSTWSALGASVDYYMYPQVACLSVLGSKVYVGGDFLMVSSPFAGNIACWNPATSAWSALGAVNDPVRTIAVWDGKLYVGSDFTTAEGITVNRIACWDPSTSTWSALGSGMDGDVYALVVHEGRLYVGGLFTTAGGVTASRIAYWDLTTSTWSALGSGMNNGVYALTVLDGRLYAGGRFTTAGEVSANNVACWDLASSTWSALGTGVTGFSYPHPRSEVFALVGMGGRLYVGGEFTTAGGISANHIAAWDPPTSTWLPVGSGTGEAVRALTVIDDTLYAGGEFYTAGEQVSVYWARWGRAGPQADLDCDLDVDMDDLDLFEACVTGSGVAYDPLQLSPGCTLTPDGENHIAADLDADGDVDQADFGVFQRCLSGPDTEASRYCAN